MAHQAQTIMFIWNDYFRIICFVAFSSTTFGFGQIGLGTTTPSIVSELDINSTSKGILIPRMTASQMNAISNPAQGLYVFNTDAEAYYYFDGDQWLSTLNSFKVYANAGVDVSFDQISVRIPTSGNRSIQLKSNSGTLSIAGSSINAFITTSAGTSGSSSFFDGWNRGFENIGTSYVYWQSTANFPMHGSIQEIYLTDQTNGRSYRVLCIIGSGYNNNFFEIERLR